MIRFINVPEGGRLKVRLLFDNSIDPAGFSFHGGNASVMDGQAPPSISFTTEVIGREVVMTSSEIGLWPASIPYEIRVSRNSDNSSWLVLEGGINVETVAAGDAPLGEGVDGDAEAGGGVYVPEYDPQTVVLTVSEEEGRIVFGPYSGGGGGGGDVYKDLNNVFTGVNTFNNHAVKATAGVEVGEADGESVEHTIYRSGDDLYWGSIKLNCQGGGGGDVYACSNNCFTGVNRFWNDGGIILGNTAKSCSSTLKYDTGNLLWGACEVVVAGALDSYVTKTALSGCGYAKTSALNSYVTKTSLAGCRFARLGCDNVFTGANVFNGGGTFYTWMEFYGDATFHKHVNIEDGGSDLSSAVRLQNHNGDLYWGTSKLNDQGGGGDVYTFCSNVFTGSNTFSGDVTFNVGTYFNDRESNASCNLLYNYNGDLYWGDNKLNGQGGGGGDVTSVGNNCFTGFNKFYNSNGIAIGTDSGNNKQLKYVSSSLYWGTCAVATAGDLECFVTKSDLSSCCFAHKTDISDLADKAGNNEFTGTNTFKGGVLFNSTCAVDLGSSGVRVRNTGDSVPDYSTCMLVNSNGDLYWGTSVIGSLPDSMACVIGSCASDCTSLRNNKAYKVEFPLTATCVVRDISGIRVCSAATAEIGVDMRHCQHSVVWPSCWYWLDGTSADGGDHNVHPSVLDWGSHPMHHTVAVRRDDWKVLANVLYSYRIPGLTDASQGTE